MRRHLVTAALLASAVATAAQVNDQSLLTPDPQDWLMLHRDFIRHEHRGVCVAVSAGCT